MMQERHLQFVVIHLGTVANIIHLHLNRPLPHGQLFKLLEKLQDYMRAVEIGVMVIVPQIIVTRLVVTELPLHVGIIIKDGTETLVELLDVRLWKVK